MSTRRPTRPGAPPSRAVPQITAPQGAGQPDDWDANFIMAPTVRLVAAQRAVAASDSSGHLLAFARMDRAPLLCVQIAQDKAYSVASFGGLPTAEWWRLLESEPALLHGIVKTDRLVVFGGGVPLVSDGRTVGGIGVSGGSSEQDVRIAEAGASVVA
jgi:glc operon protein GlcG